MRLLLSVALTLLALCAAAQPVADTLYTQSNGPLVQKTDWTGTEYRGNPWVRNTSLPYTVTRGLQGRHLSLCASHGRYFDVAERQWAWQRPTIFCTIEDIFTQTFAVPFIYPMLERAGAIVWTPRERSWMREEVIVDNDHPDRDGVYEEWNGQQEWKDAGTGFAHLREVYLDGQNPHEEGTARIAESQANRRRTATARWTPKVPKAGNYAVYVSYPRLDTNVPDARYTICHGGITTHVRVNQQMGGGTWVYLGTYDFTPGLSNQNYVELSNQSNYRGTVAADALRLGGGMGNIARADSTGVNPQLSGLPRYLEAARYSQQWNGMPYEVYSVRQGGSDYADDINARPMATNHLARGSVYLPGDSGLCVPLELSFALHSDAGFSRDNDFIGTLTLHTSDFEDGLYPSGLQRKAAGRLTAQLNEQIRTDLTRLYGKWTMRGTWDKNYGETRVPRIPGVILEMFSHQNLADLRLGHDPTFKFHLSRAVYKAILRYTAQMHGTDAVTVQPLPVQAFTAVAEPINRHIRLTWRPTDDPLEPTARPTGYIVYQKQGDGGWDNGTPVTEPTCLVTPQPGVLYRFRVEAVNEGGASLPSEELCAMLSPQAGATNTLIVNAFTRLAAPYSFVNDSLQGFRLDEDPGVACIHTPGLCGRQQYFGKTAVEGVRSKQLGYSSSELVGTLVMGNTFDYPTQHALDFIASGRPLNISSASRLAFEQGTVQPQAYQLLDVIMGAQRTDGYTRQTFQTLTPAWDKILYDYTQKGGALLLSGAYLGTDLNTDSQRDLTSRILHCTPAGPERADSLLTIEGMNTQCSLLMQPNEHHLSTAYTSVLQPAGTAFSILLYPNSRHSAAVAYQGADYRAITLGFPIEQIQEDDTRRTLMAAFLKFLIK
ncbi:MAG: hypothetical protein MJZ35_01820 [Bacteroidaceae bacterium]|nr:hypothetical protein [Bacteroidaceae bacterium]